MIPLAGQNIVEKNVMGNFPSHQHHDEPREGGSGNGSTTPSVSFSPSFPLTPSSSTGTALSPSPISTTALTTGSSIFVSTALPISLPVFSSISSAGPSNLVPSVSTSSATLVPSTSTSTSVTMLSSASAVSTSSHGSALSQNRVNAGAITGGVIGGLVFIALIVLGIIIYMRRRRRLHTPPSAEFMSGRTLMAPLGPTLGSSRAESFNSTSELTRNPSTSQSSAATPHNAAADSSAFTPGNYPFPYPEKLSHMTPL